MKHRRTDEWAKAGIVIGAEVDISRIADDVVIHPACRIRGKETSMGSGSVIGAEAPATIDNCQLGRNVELKGGTFSGATFLDGAKMGSGAHVRQTILLPFVTLGSLVNFCDILMAGGTNRKNHSEVGSSYIHFNYTPHQDKATASLVGDVSQGVFLDNKPIFLGGQGGLVGPVRMAYGSVVAAGGICRQDIVEENQLHIPSTPKPGTQPYETGVYGSIDRIVKNNLLYIGNMVALKEWYRNVRQVFMCRDRFDKACLAGGLNNIDMVLAERINRLGDFAQNLKHSFQWLEKQDDAPEDVVASQHLFHNAWETMEFELRQSGWTGNTAAMDTFLSAVDHMPVGGSYIEAIQSLEPETRKIGRLWLQSIVDEVGALWTSK